MADNIWRHQNLTQVKQVYKADVTTTTIGHTYVITLTLSDSSTEAVTITLTAAESTTTLAAAAFVTAWNASQQPGVKAITASNSANTVILTADNAGEPFSAATSGTGTWANDGTTTTCVSNTDYGQAGNWDLDAVPVATDDVIVPLGEKDILWSLDQSGVAIGDFRVKRECRSNFGRVTDGKPFYLQIDPNLFRYEGNGNRALFDIGGAAIAPYIDARGTKEQNQPHNIYFKGSGITTLTVVRGNVGLAPFEGDTATIATLAIRHIDNPHDAQVTVYSGVTLTTLDQNSGICELNAGCTTATVQKNGILKTEGSGTITTLNAYGEVFANSSGTITTANIWGTVDMSKDRTARTITTVNAKPGGVLIVHSDITITTLNGLAEAGDFKLVYVE